MIIISLSLSLVYMNGGTRVYYKLQRRTTMHNFYSYNIKFHWIFVLDWRVREREHYALFNRDLSHCACVCVFVLVPLEKRLEREKLSLCLKERPPSAILTIYTHTHTIDVFQGNWPTATMCIHIHNTQPDKVRTCNSRAWISNAVSLPPGFIRPSSYSSLCPQLNPDNMFCFVCATLSSVDRAVKGFSRVCGGGSGVSTRCGY